MEKSAEFPVRLSKVHGFEYDQVGLKISLHLFINHSLLTLCIFIELEGGLQVEIFACINKSISVEINGVQAV